MNGRQPMRRLRAIWLPGVVAWLVLQAPGLAAACSVCSAGRDEENQAAFLLSTIFMSLLPLLVIGTFVFVLWRRIRKLEAEEGLSGEGAPASNVPAG